MTKRRRKFRPKYPYTLLSEALELYKADVFQDDEARNRFLVHIQPLVRHCVGRVTSAHSGAVLRRVEDVVGFVNVKLLESWLPKYLGNTRRAARIKGAVKYLFSSIRGHVLNYIKKNFDLRTVPLTEHDERSQSVAWGVDMEEINSACDRMVAEHVALRPRPDLDMEVVRKLMRYLVWEKYRRTDGLSG